MKGIAIRNVLNNKGDMMPQDITAVANATPHNMKQITITQHRIGKKTYIVESSSSETATDTVKSKIEKLILRDCGRMMADEGKKSVMDVVRPMSAVID